jgi:arylsulfatase
MRPVLAVILAVALGGAAAPPPPKPNILLIVADDLGFSDLSATGSEVATPNIDRLAHEGRLLTGMHSTGMPTSRAALMTGADPHLVGYGSMGPPAGRQVGKPGYERGLNGRSVTLAERLKAAGYRTLMAGAWGLGFKPEQGPAARGFERSFALTEVAADYFAPEAARLSKSESLTYREDGREAAWPGGYMTDVYADRLIGFLREGRGDPRPFFAYASFTAPHFPLQAPNADIARQKGRYDAGYEAIRVARLARQRASKLLPAVRTPAPPVPEAEGYKAWASLTPAERAVEARRAEIYAAMIERLDAAVGRIVAELRASRAYDRTLIVFTSGNGAADTWRHRRRPEDVDNSLANLGRRHSWISYSERWAEVSNAPFAQWKGRMTEGGITVPTIVRLPGQAAGRSATDAAAVFPDLTATLLQAAGADTAAARRTWPNAAPMEGRSLLPLLQGRATTVHPPTTVFAAEGSGEAYVRQGRWKAVRLVYAAPGSPQRMEEEAAIARGDLAAGSAVRARFPRVWRLYDVVADRGETRDLAAREPQTLKRMQGLFDAYAARVGVVDP